MVGGSNLNSSGSGGTLTVTAPAYVTVTASKDGKTYTRTANAQGVAVFKGLKTGVWSVTISDGVQNPTTMQVEVTADYALTINFFMATIAVTYPAGSVCKCSKGSNVLTAVGTSGSYTFTVPEAGEWVVSCTDGTDTATKTVVITEDGQEESVSLEYVLYAADFDWDSYGVAGTDYEIVDDDDMEIPESEWPTKKDWKARLLTSNTLIPTADGEIDVFLVGGGGAGITGNAGWGCSGGGGGYTITNRSVKVYRETSYPIVIGAGGISKGGDGGSSSAFESIANGGQGGQGNPGGNGGSGGGGGAYNGAGGSDGNNGGSGQHGKGGTGQGFTTGEFGDSNNRKYSGGGGSGNSGGAGGESGGKASGAPPDTNAGTGKSAASNSGGGGGGGGKAHGAGGSGIVIIRNARGGAA